MGASNGKKKDNDEPKNKGKSGKGAKGDISKEQDDAPVKKAEVILTMSFNSVLTGFLIEVEDRDVIDSSFDEMVERLEKEGTPKYLLTSKNVNYDLAFRMEPPFMS